MQLRERAGRDRDVHIDAPPLTNEHQQTPRRRYKHRGRGKSGTCIGGKWNERAVLQTMTGAKLTKLASKRSRGEMPFEDVIRGFNEHYTASVLATRC